jgi:thioredoxin-like negative regulator of GroEL
MMSEAPAISERQAAARKPETQRPQLLFFFSPTSGASRRAEGFLAQVLQRNGNHSTFRLVRIDVDRRPDLIERLRVTELPTLLVVSEGRVRARLAKPTGVRPIRALLAPWLR